MLECVSGCRKADDFAQLAVIRCFGNLSSLVVGETWRNAIWSMTRIYAIPVDQIHLTKLVKNTFSLSIAYYDTKYLHCDTCYFNFMFSYLMIENVTKMIDETVSMNNWNRNRFHILSLMLNLRFFSRLNVRMT